MRYFEIASSVQIPISCEEQDLLDKVKSSFPRDDLDERDQEVARLMVSRGVLRQVMKDQKVFYKPNSDKDIWRDRDG